MPINDAEKKEKDFMQKDGDWLTIFGKIDFDEDVLYDININLGSYIN